MTGRSFHSWAGAARMSPMRGAVVFTRHDRADAASSTAHANRAISGRIRTSPPCCRSMVFRLRRLLRENRRAPATTGVTATTPRRHGRCNERARTERATVSLCRQTGPHRWRAHACGARGSECRSLRERRSRPTALAAQRSPSRPRSDPAARKGRARPGSSRHVRRPGSIRRSTHRADRRYEGRPSTSRFTQSSPISTPLCSRATCSSTRCRISSGSSRLSSSR